MDLLLFTILYALPCWLVNMSFNFIRPLRKRFPFFQTLNFPLDFYKKAWDGRRIFGDSQGALSIINVLVLPFIFTFIFPQPLWVLLLSAVCVWVGDMAGSFIKRRIGIERGAFLPGVDHGDYMIVTGIVFVSLGIVPFGAAFFALLLTYILHPVVCMIGYSIGVKKEPI